MLNLVIGGAGSGKSTRLIEMISESVDIGRNIIIIVPEQFTYEFEKKLYYELGVTKFNSVSVLSFSRLSEVVFNMYGSRGGEYIDDTTKTALVFLAIKAVKEREAMLFYERQADSPGFVKSVCKVIEDLRTSGISPELFSSKLPLLNNSIHDKSADIALIYSEYTRILAEKGFKDRLDDISEAARSASRNGFFNNTYIYIDEFKSFTGDEYDMLSAMLCDSAEVNIALTTEKPSASASSVFYTVNETLFSLERLAKENGVKVKRAPIDGQIRFKSRDLAHLGSNICRNGDYEKIPAENIKITEAHDIYEEADYIAAEIRSLVRKGYRYGEIAVLSRSLGEYEGVLEGAFEKYDISYFMDIKKPVAHQAVTMAISSALEAISARRYSTEVLLRLAKTGMVGLSYEEISFIEDFCYKWSVEGDMWVAPFKTTASDNPKGGGKGNAAESERQAEEARQKLILPLERLKADCRRASGKDMCRAIYGYMTEVGMDSAVAISVDEAVENAELLAEERDRRQLWDVVMEVLDKLYSALGDSKLSLSVFSSLLKTMLSDITISSPPQTLDAVTVTAAERGRLAAPRAVFVIGANDGIFPFAVTEKGLFSDRDKKRLEDAGIKLSKDVRHMLSEERFIVYNTLCAPSEKLFVSYPLSGASGKVRYPSPIIDEMQRLFANNILNRAADYGAEFYCSTKKAAYSYFIRDYANRNSTIASLKSVLYKDAFYRSRIEYIYSISGERDYRITDATTAKALFGENIYFSPSRFEDFMNCRFYYFCNKGLGLYSPERISIDGRITGNLIHYCMSELLRNVPKERFVSMGDSEIKGLIDRLSDDYLRLELGGGYISGKRFEIAYKRVGDIAFQTACRVKRELSQSGFVPSDFEISIGPGGDIPPKKLITDSGAAVYFSGTADRVDVFAPEGDNGKKYIRVIDYKTGKFNFSTAELYYGIHSQAILYLYTLSSIGKYKGCIPAGALYMPAGVAELKEPKEVDKLIGPDGNIDMVKAEVETDKSLAMNGVLLNDGDVMAAMETEENKLRFLKNLSKRGGLLDGDSFDRLNGYIEGLLKSAADSLHSGDISAIPLKRGDIAKCKYCPYKGICDKSANSKEIIFDPDMAKSELYKIINPEESCGDKTDGEE